MTQNDVSTEDNSQSDIVDQLWIKWKFIEANRNQINSSKLQSLLTQCITAGAMVEDNLRRVQLQLLAQEIGDELYTTEGQYPEIRIKAFKPQSYITSENANFVAASAQAKGLTKLPSIPYEYSGRDDELKKLKEFVQEKSIIIIYGVAGIGKSTLTRKLVEDVEPEIGKNLILVYKFVLSRPFNSFLSRVYEGLFGSKAPAENCENDLLDDIFESLNKQRWLIILDNFETIIQEIRSSTKPESNGYVKFFREAADREHKSCFLLTTRESPRLLTKSINKKKIGEIALTNLSTNDYKHFLKKAFEKSELNEKSVSLPVRTDKELDDLITKCSGNTLIFREVVNEIISKGENISEYLKLHENENFSQLEIFLEERESDFDTVQKELMFWLVVNRAHEWINLSKLRKDFLEPFEMNIMQRPLLGLTYIAEDDKLTVTTAVLDYFTKRFVEEIKKEINLGIIDGSLHRHALFKAYSNEENQKEQVKLILRPLKKEFRTEELGAKLKDFFSDDHEKQLSDTYLYGNVLNMLSFLRADLSDINFSRLMIRQGYFLGLPSCDDDNDDRFEGIPNDKPDIFFKIQCSNSEFKDCRFLDSVSRVHFLAPFSNDKRVVAGEASGQISIWNVGSRTRESAWHAHNGLIWGVALDSTGNRLVSCCADGSVHLWSLFPDPQKQSTINHKLLGKLLGKEGKPVDSYIAAVAISPDGQRIVAGGESGKLTFWDQDGQWLELWDQDGQWLDELESKHQSIHALAFQPSSENEGEILAGGFRDGTICLWKLTGNTLKLIDEFSEHTDLVFRLAFSDDGKMLASCGDDNQGILWEWNSDQNRLIYKDRFTDLGKCDLAFDNSQPKQLAISNHTKNTIEIYSISFDKDGLLKENISLIEPPEGIKELNALCFCSDSILVTGSNREIRIWDTHKKQCVRTFAGYLGWITSLAFSKDGNSILSANEEGILELWQKEGDKWKRQQVSHDISTGVFSVASLTVNENEHLFATANCNGTVSLWFLRDKKFERINLEDNLKVTDDGDRTQCVAFSAKLKLLAACGKDGTVKIWDMNKPDAPRLIYNSNKYKSKNKNFESSQAYRSSVAFSKDNRFLAYCLSDEKSIGLLNINIEMIKTKNYKDGPFTWVAHDREIRSLSFHPTNSNILISGSKNGELRLWLLPDSYKNNEEPKEINRITYDKPVTCVAFSPDGEYLACACEDHSSPRVIKMTEDNKNWIDEECYLKTRDDDKEVGMINAIAFSPDSKSLVSGGRDEFIRIWDIETGNRLHKEKVFSPYLNMEITGAKGLDDDLMTQLAELGAKR